MPDNTRKIEALEEALASGLQSFTVDGQTTTFRSRDDLIREINRLKAEDDATQAAGGGRRTLNRFRLDNRW